MTDETSGEYEAELDKPNHVPGEYVDPCDRCECPDCPGVSPDTTAELAQHSKACPEKHF